MKARKHVGLRVCSDKARALPKAALIPIVGYAPSLRSLQRDLARLSARSAWCKAGRGRGLLQYSTLCFICVVGISLSASLLPLDATTLADLHCPWQSASRCSPVLSSSLTSWRRAQPDGLVSLFPVKRGLSFAGDFLFVESFKDVVELERAGKVT